VPLAAGTGWRVCLTGAVSATQLLSLAADVGLAGELESADTHLPKRIADVAICLNGEARMSAA
jgi:hypothetical protein